MSFKHRTLFLAAASIATMLLHFACSESKDPAPPQPSATATGSGGSTSATGGSSADGGSSFAVGVGGSGGQAAPCDSGPDEDKDQDGYTKNQNDCNDCDENVNPGAIEVITASSTGGAGGSGTTATPVDENCDGMIDEAPTTCDNDLALDDFDPIKGANAIEICQQSTDDKTYGLISAKYVRANGINAATEALQVGIMAKFGDNITPRGGNRLLVLSSGRARLPGQPNSPGGCDGGSGGSGGCGWASCTPPYLDSCQMTGEAIGTGGAGGGDNKKPPGFPQKVACGGGTGGSGGGPNCPTPDPSNLPIRDDIALEVALRAPTNATGYKFAFDFYTFEFPEYVCTDYNDQFVTLVSPHPPNAPADFNGNISFDGANNPVSVNVAFFSVCDASLNTGGCANGTTELLGTGFDVWGVCSSQWDNSCVFPHLSESDCAGAPIKDAGATGWLSTQAPIAGGDTVNIRFAIWDTNDQSLDSTVLIDNFSWIATPGEAPVVIKTQPAPPK